MLRLIVQNVWTWIDGFYEYGLLDPVTSYLLPGRHFVEIYKRGQWDGRVRFVKRHKETKQYYFPTGLLTRVQRFLGERNVHHAIEDQRTIEPCLNDPIYNLAGKRLDLLPREYQSEAVDACLINGRGTVQAATGSGKTLIMAAVLKTLDLPSVWLTHRINLAYQTKNTLEEALEQEVGLVGDSNIDYKKHTVGMVQSCCSPKHKEFLQTRQVIVGDEIHHLESKQWYNNFASCPAPYRFGLSATPNLEGAGLTILGMTGDVIYSIAAKELVDRGVLCTPKIYFIPVSEPVARKSAKFAEVYKKTIVENEVRNRFIVDVAKTFAEEKKNCLTLVSRVQHGELLEKLLDDGGVRSKFVYGKTSTKDREETFEKLFVGKLDNVVATAPIVGEGTDFPALQSLINATGGKGGGNSASADETGRITIQILGRGLRTFPGKKEFEYVDFSDSMHRFTKNASLDRINTLKSEGYEGFIDLWVNR